MNKHTVVTTACLLAAALALGACASDSESGTPPSVTFATTPPATAADTAAPTTEAPPADTAGTQPTATEPTAASTPATTVAPAPVPDDSADLGEPAVQTTLVAPVELAIGMAWRPGDSAVYVVNQDGLVVPVRDGVAGDPVLDIRDVTTAQDERGLLGLAFHPTEPLAYVNYIFNDGGGSSDTIIAEYRVAADGTFDPASRREVMFIDQPHNNHNGGDLSFGPDGYLYIGMGDGGAADDPDRRSLDVSDPLGKMLRIDPRADGGKPYTVPADNPFVDVSGAAPEVFAVGLRNPWRFSFDQATGDLWIGDVGQGDWEEIDVAWADQGGGRGANFGWSAFEGTHRFNEDQSADGVTPPIHEYESSLSCSVSGGARYRGAAIPALAGWYVYGDFCSGEIRALQLRDRVVVNNVLLATVPSAAAVKAGPDGELYVLSQSDGLVAIVPAS